MSSGYYTCDAWGIGGGGAGGNRSTTYQYGEGYGGGSGYTAMATSISLSTTTYSVTIGAGASTQTYTGSSNSLGATGGTTQFQTLNAAGGSGGGGNSSSQIVYGVGGSNYNGENGTPGAGKIMSKFWSTEHNNEYGSMGIEYSKWPAYISPGGGGYGTTYAPNDHRGGGYGAGGGGMRGDNVRTGWQGNSGCLIIRIKV